MPTVHRTVAALIVATLSPLALAQTDLVANDGELKKAFTGETWNNVDAYGFGTSPSPNNTPGEVWVVGATVLGRLAAFDAGSAYLYNGTVASFGVSNQGYGEMASSGFSAPTGTVQGAAGVSDFGSMYLQKGTVLGNVIARDDGVLRIDEVNIGGDVILDHRSVTTITQNSSLPAIIQGALIARGSADVTVTRAQLVDRIEMRGATTGSFRDLSYNPSHFEKRDGTPVRGIAQYGTSSAEYRETLGRFWVGTHITRGRSAVGIMELNENSTARIFGIDVATLNLNGSSNTTVFGGVASSVALRDNAKLTWHNGDIVNGIHAALSATICVTGEEFTALDAAGNTTPIDLTGPGSTISLDSGSGVFYEYINHEGFDVFGLQGLTRWHADGSSHTTDFWFETTGPDTWTGSLILTVPAPGTLGMVGLGLLAARRRR